jgi:hypothetical protein
MSVTLRKLARQVIKIESGGNRMRDSHLSEAYVILHIRQALAKIVKPLYYENLNSDDRSTPVMYIIPYKVEVKVDDDTQRKYFDLPDFFIHLPFNKGLRAVTPVDDPLNEFVPKHNPGVSFNLPCGDLQGLTGYWIEGMKVFIDDKCELDWLLCKLLCPAPDSIEEDDPLPIYPEQQDDVIRLTREILANQPVQDRLADGNKDIGVRIQPAK